MNKLSTRSLSRRQAMQTIVSAGVISLAQAMPANAVTASAQNRIQRENSLPGTKDWMLTKIRVEPASRYRCPWIEGYCSRTSVRRGESISFHVSTNPVSRFSIDIFRLGYYGGTGGRLMKALGSFDGRTQTDPPTGTKRLRSCDWQAATRLRIPRDWTSGVYVAKLTAEREGLQSYAIFIVRDDRKADFIFQCSDSTWQAYNRWPSQFSLYDDGKSQWYWGGKVQVSFNRPYGKYCQIMDQPLSLGSGEFFLWEFPMVFWLEEHGLDVTYISNLDTHTDPRGLLRAKGMLSVGHDEYWSIEMFRNVQAAINAGVNVGFFSGNAVCGRILFDPSQRAFERVGVYGPPGGTREFESMSSIAHERPYANELVGAHSTGSVTGGADWICAKADHWIYEGTGMKNGDRIPGVIGWEWHGDPAPIPSLKIVATGPTEDSPGHPNGGIYTATIYQGPKDNFVFNAATCWWADGLSQPPGYIRPKVYTEPKGPDSRIQRITLNILEKMRGRG